MPKQNLGYVLRHSVKLLLNLKKSTTNIFVYISIIYTTYAFLFAVFVFWWIRHLRGGWWLIVDKCRMINGGIRKRKQSQKIADALRCPPWARLSFLAGGWWHGGQIQLGRGRLHALAPQLHRNKASTIKNQAAALSPSRSITSIHKIDWALSNRVVSALPGKQTAANNDEQEPST